MDYVGHLQLLVGCFFGAVFSSIWGEKLGRRRSVFIGCVFLIIGAVLQAASYTRAMMIVGRIVAGVGMGTVNSTVPVMQAEFSPKSSRGICELWSSIMRNHHLMLYSCLRSAFDSQLRYLPRLLDRLCPVIPHRQLCLACSRHSSMCSYPGYYGSPVCYSRDTTLVSSTRQT
jgi:hypothetical protein